MNESKLMMVQQQKAHHDCPNALKRGKEKKRKRKKK